MIGALHLSAGEEGTHGPGRMLDELAANATVAPTTRLVGGWLHKSAPDLPFRRANAVLPSFGAGLDLETAAAVLSSIERTAAVHGQRVLVQVSSADPSAVDLDGFLAEQGYAVEAPVDLLTAETSEVLAAASERARSLADAGRVTLPVEVVVSTGVDLGWAARYGRPHDEDGDWRGRTAAYGEMLASLGPAVLNGVALALGAPTGALLVAGSDQACGNGGDHDSRKADEDPAGGQADPDVGEGGDDGPVRAAATRDQPSRIEVAGVGFAVVERGWAGIYGMATAIDHRRGGVARALLAGLASHAARSGAQHLYLQVEQDNGPAQRLYRSMGFGGHHRYHYRVSRSPDA